MDDIITETQDLRYLHWSKVRRSSGTAGSFLKAVDGVKGHEIYYKLSDFDPVDRMVGFECLNELVADRLMTILGIEHLSYQLVHADIVIDGVPYNTYICKSKNFRKKSEQKVTLEDYFAMYRQPNETPFLFCQRMGWGEYIGKMLLVDFLILNRDRHGANIEVLRDSTGAVHPAPLFDHGLSLLCRSKTPEEIRSFDVMEDRKVQSFVGCSSAHKNLEFLSSCPPQVRLLHESDRESLLSGLTELYPPMMGEKVWEMIWERWCYYENLCHR